MNYYCYLMFMPILLLSNLLMLISNSWFSFWMIMELNMISFLCLLLFNNNLNNEILINYFIVQSFNSYLFLVSMILLNYNNMFLLMLLLMNLSLLTKLGMPPFYLWYVKLMNNLNMVNIFILSVLQKFIPMLILSNMFFNKFMVNLNLINLLIFGIYLSMMGMKQISIKLIICYSSMIQMFWMIMLMMFNEIIWLNYFIIYSIIMLNLIILLKYLNINNLINMNMFKSTNKLFYYMMNFSIFSLASMPPFFGFLMKLMTIQILFNYTSIILLMLIIINSVMSMMFYLRILFINIMLNSMTNKLNFSMINFININENKFIYLIWLNMILLLMYEMI